MLLRTALTHMTALIITRHLLLWKWRGGLQGSRTPTAESLSNGGNQPRKLILSTWFRHPGTTLASSYVSVVSLGRLVKTAAENNATNRR